VVKYCGFILDFIEDEEKKMVFAEIEEEYEQSETYRSKKNFMVLQNLDSGARKNFTFLGLNLCCLI
jgi:hypothetical protein